jgi:tocopherol O-methyltransferase
VGAFESDVVRHYDDATVEYRFFGENLHWGLYAAGEAATSKAQHVAAAQRMTAEVVSAAEVRAGYRVLDAGCGIGTTALYLARQHACSVVGVNITASQIEIARKKAAEAGVEDHVSFELADCSKALPLDDASVDAIVTMECGVHLADRATFFRECARCLRPGGLLSGEDWFARDGLSQDEYTRHIQLICDTWVFPDIGTLSSYARLLEDAGLEVRRTLDLAERARENVRTLDRIRRLVAYSPGLRTGRWAEMAPALESAWRDGYFTLGTYVARKP